MSQLRIAVIGSSGMLGQELVRSCTKRDMDLHNYSGSESLDVTNSDAVSKAIRGFDVVINSSGYTDVDGAESDSESAMKVNQLGPKNLAKACLENNALLVHYSTDYIFNGASIAAHRIDDEPGPCNIYGLSKLAGEKAIRETGCKHLIIRTSWLFAAHSKNFVRTIFRESQLRDTLKVVSDQVGRPTLCSDLAQQTLDILASSAQGTFHVTNGGSCSWYEFAKEIISLMGNNCIVQPCKTSDFPRPAARPGNSVLDLGKTIKLIGKPRDWKIALGDCIEELINESKMNEGDSTITPKHSISKNA